MIIVNTCDCYTVCTITSYPSLLGMHGIEAYTTTAVQKLIKLVTSSKGCLSSLKAQHCKGSNNLYHWDVTTSCESCKANDGPFFHSLQTLTVEAHLPGESRGLTHRHSLDGGMAQGNGGPNDPWVEVCPEVLWQYSPQELTFFEFLKFRMQNFPSFFSVELWLEKFANRRYEYSSMIQPTSTNTIPSFIFSAGAKERMDESEKPKDPDGLALGQMDREFGSIPSLKQQV